MGCSCSFGLNSLGSSTMAAGFHTLLTLSLLFLASSNHKARAISVMLKTLEYNVKGEVTIEGQKIIVDNFSYTGAAPDAFFYVGTSGCPSEKGTLIQYPAGDADRPLGAYSGQRVELDLPTSISADEVAWVSVWCRQYSIVFGYAFLTATDMDNCGGQQDNSGSSRLGLFAPTL